MAQQESENMLIWNSTFIGNGESDGKCRKSMVVGVGLGKKGIGWGASSDEEGGKKRGIKA